MRKIFATALVISLGAALTGCLKDKEFEDQKYGLQVKEVKAVAFPQASKSPIVIGINSSPTPQTFDGPFVTLEEDKAPASPVTVTLEIDQSIVTNTDPSLVPLGPTEFSINSLTVTFAAGEKVSDAVKIIIPNSLILNPLNSYGIGLRIKSVDQGYKIAANQKELVIAFNIKNKYDGIYTLKGKHNRSPYTFPYEVTAHMITAGPSSVSYYLPDVANFGHPIGVGPDPLNDWSWYGATLAPVLVFDASTDLVSNVYNGGGATPVVPYNAGGLQGRYDPTTKTIYAYFYYYTAGGQDFTNRGWSDTLYYVSPRP